MNEKQKALEAIKGALVGRVIVAVDWADASEGLQLKLDDKTVLDFGYNWLEGETTINGKQIKYQFYDENGNDL